MTCTLTRWNSEQIKLDKQIKNKHTKHIKHTENKMSDNNAYEQAKAQANSIGAMVAALNVDYDRLEDLKDELANLEYYVSSSEAGEREHRQAMEALAQWRAEYAEELRELEESANGNESEEEAREAIRDDALDVQVRSDWHAPDEKDVSPSNFQILLCTGGPAVRIMGELNDYCEPTRAWIEYQDWGTPWTEAPGIIPQDVLLQYCQQFYFGE
jgi:hypothetical protein